jgi:cysteine desulfurase/selenocysteine lyase
MLNVKEQFPLFAQKENEKLVYLESAVTTQKPQMVIDAMRQNMEHTYGSVHRGAYGLTIASSEMVERVRAQCAAFVSPSLKPENIIFTKGTTESLNILANGFRHTILTPHHRIVLPKSEHHANLVPWQQTSLAVDCEIAYLSFEGKTGKSLKLNLSEAEKLITKNTKIVTLASMGNGIGQINPVAEIAQMAKKVGAYVFVDCAQSASCLDTDFFALGADAVAFGAHKMYGPSGIGILALSSELMDKLPPLLFGGGMISKVTLEESAWTTGPAKFEAGTPPITEAAGFGAALSWVESVGRNNIHHHSAALASAFIEGLKSLPDIEIFAPETGAETIVSFRHAKIHAHDLVTILDTFGVCMRAGHHCAWPLIQFLDVDALVRASFGAYSTQEDVEKALFAIKESHKFM